MRNLKKLLAVIVAICVLASFTVPAFAADATSTYGTQAKGLYDMGLFKGESTSQYVPALEKSLTKEQGIILLVRLFGKEADAIAMTDADTVLKPFTDAAKISSYAKNYVAYAVKNGLVKGDTDTTVGAQTAFNGTMIAAVILRQLGYTDAAYATSVATLATKGATLTADEVKALEGVALTRDTACGIMFASLKSTYATGGKTIIATLVASGAVTEAAAIAAGVYTAAPAVPAVTGITGTNMKELVVAFNAELDKTSAETVGNYSVGGADVASATLGADKKTVTIAVADAKIIDNGASYDVVVEKAIKNAAGVAMAADYTAKVPVLDKDLPDATAIKLTGPNTFDITFSEPIKTAGTVKVNNGIYGVTSVSTGSTVSVKLSATTLPDGNYTINISGFKDYANLANISKDMTLAYAKATDAITATLKSASQTKAVIVFNRKINIPSGKTKEEYFYQTFTAWMPTTASVASDNVTWTLDFSGDDKQTPKKPAYPIPSGTTNVVVRYVSGSEITDDWGNKLSTDIVVPVTVSADTTAPVVVTDKTVADTEDTLKVYFSEDMSKSLAEDKTKYVFKDSTGKDISSKVKTIVYTADATNSVYYVTVTFTAKLDGGNYTVDIKDLTDISLSANKLVAITVPFTISDKTPITLAAGNVTITAIDGDTEAVYIQFGEKVAITGANSALDKNNYQVTVANGATTTPAITSLALYGDSGKVVKMVLENTTGFAGQLTTSGTSGVKVGVGRVADLAGNLPTGISFTYDVHKEAGASVTKVKQIASNKLEITVDKRLISVLPDAFLVSTASAVRGTTLAAIDSWKNNDDGTATIIGTVTDDFITNKLKIETGFGEVTTKTSIVIPEIWLIGEYLVTDTNQKSTDQTNGALTVVDYRAPELLSVTTNSATGGSKTTHAAITLNFSEAMDNAVGGAGNATLQSLTMWYEDLIVEQTTADGTKTLQGGTDYTLVIAGGQVQIEQFAADSDGGNALAAGTYKISTKSTVKNMWDKTPQMNKLVPKTTALEITLP